MANGRNPGAARGRSHQAVRLPLSITVQSSAVEGLDRLERDMLEKVLRPAAYAGAKVFYDAMRRNVPVRNGDLYNSIYHFFDDKMSSATRKTYVIGPNKVKAPHWYNVEYGHWLYNRYAAGRWLRSKSNKNARGPGAHDLPGALKEPKWVPARPYIRTTWTSSSQIALDAMKKRMAERFREVVAEIKA